LLGSLGRWHRLAYGIGLDLLAQAEVEAMNRRAVEEKNWESMKSMMLRTGSIILTDEAMSDKVGDSKIPTQVSVQIPTHPPLMNGRDNKR